MILGLWPTTITLVGRRRCCGSGIARARRLFPIGGTTRPPLMTSAGATAPKVSRCAGLGRPIEHAGRTGRPGFSASSPHHGRATLIVELALLGDVLAIEWLASAWSDGWRLRMTMTWSPGAGPRPFGLRLRGLACRAVTRAQDGAGRCKPNDVPHHGQLLQCYCLRRADASTRDRRNANRLSDGRQRLVVGFDRHHQGHDAGGLCRCCPPPT